VIKVPRFFCENNYRERVKTGEKKQYTLTILPGFLVPYSIIPLDVIHEAVDRYINESVATQQASAFCIMMKENNLTNEQLRMRAIELYKKN